MGDINPITRREEDHPRKLPEMALSILGWVSLASALGRALGNPIVTDVQPRRIGYGGGAVTIHGQGFSEDVFSQFDPVLGNKVWFANEFVSVVCKTPISSNFLLENEFSHGDAMESLLAEMET